MNLKSTFIITSVINFSSNKLSYSSSRSVFSPYERVEQTLKTISSIHEKVPGASIVFLEIGGKNEISSEIKRLVDKYVFIGSNLIVKWACNSFHKGLGEAIGLLIAGNALKTDAEIYFKISGRYFLNNDFDLNRWSSTKFCCRIYESGISTRLYSISNSAFHEWQKALRMSLFQLYKGVSIEDSFIKFLPTSRIQPIDLLGISGFIAPNAEYISE